MKANMAVLTAAPNGVLLYKLGLVGCNVLHIMYLAHHRQLTKMQGLPYARCF